MEAACTCHTAVVPCFTQYKHMTILEDAYFFMKSCYYAKFYDPWISGKFIRQSKLIDGEKSPVHGHDTSAFCPCEARNVVNRYSLSCSFVILHYR